MSASDRSHRASRSGLSIKGAVAGLLALSAAAFGVASAGASTPVPRSAQVISYLAGVSCPEETQCVAIGGTAANRGETASYLGAKSWTGSAGPALADAISVSCPSKTTCVATGYQSFDSSLDSYTDPGVAYTTNADAKSGPTWHVTSALPSPFQTPGAITCTSTSDCLAVGSSDNNGVVPTIIRSTNGGKSWAAFSLSATFSGVVGELDGISCPSASSCFAVGSDASGVVGVMLESKKANTSSGSSWTLASLPGSTQPLWGISCPSTSDCFASGGAQTSESDGDILATTNATASVPAWKLSKGVPSGLGDLYGISCSSTKDCVAVGQEPTGASAIVETTSADAKSPKWAKERYPSASDGPLYAVSCVKTACYAVGTNHDGTLGLILHSKNSGANWGAVTLPAGK